MCGICGFVGDVRPDVLAGMRDALVHRGPDESGVHSDGRVQLGHRRLSVIDLVQGQQPFKSDDGSIVVVFNGEIYNHEQLREQLEAKGHRFRTRCDTESIVFAYREFGERCPEHLDGMFTFVLYDRETMSLWYPYRDGLRGISGEHFDQFLPEIKSKDTTWQQWINDQPNTKILK